MALMTAARWFALLSFVYVLATVSAFSNDRSDNLAVYWGQDSGGNQQRLSFYCDDDTIDAFPLAFLYVFFGKGGKPMLDLSNICSQSGSGSFKGTNLADCSFLTSDIRTCQAKGKIVTLSLGGATGKVGFNSDSQARGFARDIWDLFLGGDSNTRPFGSAVLDGIDLDIESGSSAHYAAFVNELRSFMNGSGKRYYITAAPQCPFPDQAIGAALNGASFDAVYVQFYNNFCESSRPKDFNFDTWANWARKQSPNKNVKVYLGAPGAPSAAGDGYVNINTLINLAKDAQKRYPSFGGVMLWDASEARSNNRYDRAIKQALVQDQPSRPPTTTVPSRQPGTTREPATTRAPATTLAPAPAPSPTTTSFAEPEILRPQRGRVMPQTVIHPNLNSRFFRL